jgi:hypothetical protein
MGSLITDNYIFTRCAVPAEKARGRALLVAYRFPPHDVGVAQHRPEALYRHLAEFGWDCDVITAQREGSAPGIIQTEDRSWVRTINEEGTAEAQLKQRLIKGSRTGFGPIRRSMLRQLKLLLRLQPRWHDEFAGWSYSIADTILATARERGSQVLWVTCSPYTLAPVAVRCARELGIPCVIDLRDPLPHYLHFPRGSGHWYYRALARADLISIAAPCCITSELLQVRSASRHPLPVQIASGAWQSEPVPARRSEQFRLLHAGTLANGGRSPQPLFEAVEILRKGRPEIAESLRITFIGADSEVVRDFPGYNSVNQMVEILGQTPYAEVQEMMAQASMLIMIKLDGDAYSDALPAKMYDYLPYEAPVLSFGMSAGLQGPLLEWSNAGRWIGEPEAIADFIEEQYLIWQSQKLVIRERRPEALAYLGQRRMAGDFAALFNALLDDTEINSLSTPPWQQSEGGL